MTGVELKNALDKVLGGPVSYGAIRRGMGIAQRRLETVRLVIAFPVSPHFDSAQFSSDEAS